MKKPIGRKPKYPIEYYITMAKRVTSGEMTYRQAAKAFGVSHGVVGTWVKKFKKGTILKSKKKWVETDNAKIQRQDAHIKELKAEIAELYLQNQMLKKAITYAQSLEKESSSVITSENLDQSEEDVE
jgi:transposase